MIESAAWLALLAPANTDKTVVDKLYKAMVEAVNDPKVRALFVEQGAEPLVMAPKGLTDYMTAETTKWAAIIKQIGIEPM
ncbi:tripartite-type tricarboxylate transporter receptor subunit TctC [Bradyrhizobium sp. cir1]|nr:tripartite tricarboxylate transporter substrate-binding protein [Bradyrhizobium sp. cir1]MBB4369316.1 tripartite-type tricarboxylate transporter receptor subunit TctC [Bradyrhizobium sp. cir1]